MPNNMTDPTNFPRRINNYVPAMQYSADVNYNGLTRVNFGTPAVADTDAVLAAQSIATLGTVDISAVSIPDKYGRTLTIVASGTATATCSIKGWDYLGQPVTETVTLNGATPVVMKKAFKTLDKFINNGTVAATTVDVGIGTGFGLPYKAIKAEFETTNGTLAAAGTLTGPILTDPQTATTGDPRGTYVPTTTPDGAKNITAVFDFLNDVNSSNNGGLHGIRHFA